MDQNQIVELFQARGLIDSSLAQDILAEVRCQLAKEYLRTTRLSTEHIADALGFSDAANFRHAFRRWTGKTTSEFRTGVAPRARAA